MGQEISVEFLDNMEEGASIGNIMQCVKKWMLICLVLEGGGKSIGKVMWYVLGEEYNVEFLGCGGGESIGESSYVMNQENTFEVLCSMGDSIRKVMWQVKKSMLSFLVVVRGSIGKIVWLI